eukprot:TRINITY_DN3805_c0_g2_i1.p1 TRINITY_DN3805_c0_g2~~TRINITY_DN3805_c0_g2_i1.p1  ORF type:complete len:365 (-),score=88.57 TRINITY_DN3805_c0_g2_i1:222-1316(-)
MPRSTRSTGRLAIAGAAAFLAVKSWNGPAYAVKGKWEGMPNDLKGDGYSHIFKGLEPDVDLPSMTFDREGMTLSIDKGRLNANYRSKFGEDKDFDFQINDQKAWRAGLSSDDASLHVRGEGNNLDNLFWEASQKGKADGLGDALLEFNSDKEYNLTIAQPHIATMLGGDFGGKVRFTKDGATGRLNGQAALPAGANLAYTLENEVGEYDIGKAEHNALLTVPVADGTAAFKAKYAESEPSYEASYERGLAGGEGKVDVTYKGENVKYNVSYLRSFADVLPGDLDAGVHLGVDDAGVYGRLVAHKDLADALSAKYEANGRLAVGEDDGKPEFEHSLRFSNKLGYAEILHGKNENPRVRLGYEFNA